jgi:two-component system nitrogen regulation response regulator NtrX
VLEAEGYGVIEADGGDAALAVCDRSHPEVVLLDLMMEPGPDGIAVLEQIIARFSDLVVVMMSGQATLSDAVRATKLGAFQFLEKPLSPESVLAAVGAAVELSKTRVENLALRAQLPPDDEILGASAPMQGVRHLIERVAPTPSRVLILGESGTGKELVARAIHRVSPRSKRPMVSVNCAAVPRDLLESEMFGHERGAFTGAVAARKGKFELANDSTLFLDEIGDMHIDLQAKLLRVLETGVLERVGSEREREVDVRVVAATNHDLERATAAGEFREDLFYRLNVFPIVVPPLRERLDDLPDLIRHFSAKAGAQSAKRPLEFSDEAMRRLARHTWPGNVRELANVIERLTIIGDEIVSPREIDLVLGTRARPAPSVPGRGRSLAADLEAYEREIIGSALEDANGNVAEAARILETDRANLHRRMRRLGMSRSDTNVSK